MAEELKDLIAKIQQDGVQAAQQKAAGIESQAMSKAEAIIEKAKRDADNIVEQARADARKMQDSAAASLKQAGRDLLIALRKEVASMLDKIVASHVHKALDTDELHSIISSIVKEGVECKDPSGIVVLLKKDDIEKLTRSMMVDLRDAVKKGVTLKASDDIHGGFMISYDSGKSYYDFTDASLAKHISFHLNAKLSDIFNNSGA